MVSSGQSLWGGGTEGSNRLSSSEESGANLTLLPNGDLRCRASAQPADSIEQHAGCMGGACATDRTRPDASGL